MGRVLRMLIFVTCTCAMGVSDTPKAEPLRPAVQGPYLGQEPPGFKPQVFAPGIVSLEQYREYVCVFSPDAMECVFDRYGDDLYKEGAVFVTRVENGMWIEPEIHPFFGEIDGVFQPTVSPDGTRWFFTSRTLGETKGIRGILPLFYVDVTADGWGEPVYFAQGIHASASLDGTVYYSSGFDDGRDHPAFRENVEGAYSEHRLAGFETLADGAHPVISPDGSYMVFDYDGRPAPADCNLYVSYRTHDGSWSQPVYMGSYIEQQAAIAWITADSKYIFFKADGDIYWVDAEIIAKLKPDSLK